MKRSTLLAAAACAGILAGCGGGGANLTPATGGSGGHAALSHVTITFTIPKATAAQKRPAYLSPATQSVAIVVTPNGGGAPQTFDAGLTTSDGNCSSTLISTVCTVSLALDPGDYTGAFATYNGPIVGGAPTGQTLSTDQNVPIHVVSGATNTITVALYGVPFAITVSALGDQPNVIGNQSAGFGILGVGSSAHFSVLAIDASGAFILGPGAPAFTAAVDGGPFAVTQPTTQNPNGFSVQAGAFATTANTLTVTEDNLAGATCGSDGVVCSVSMPIGSGGEAALGALYSGGAAELSTASRNISTVGPLGLAIGFNGSFSFPSFAAPYANQTGTIDVPDDGSGGLSQTAFSPSGELFAVTNAQTIDASQPPYDSFSPIYTNASLYQITPLADEAVAAVEDNGAGAYEVSILTAPGYANGGPVIGPGSTSVIYALGLDGSGKLYVGAFDTSDQAMTITTLSPPAYDTPTVVASYTSSLSYLTTLTVAPDGTVLVSDIYDGGVESLAPPFTTPAFLPLYGSIDPNGNVWVGAGSTSNIYSSSLTPLATSPIPHPDYFIP